MDSKYGRIFTEQDVRAIVQKAMENDISGEDELNVILDGFSGIFAADEPIFVLRAQDDVADVAIEDYGNLCRARGCNDQHIYNVRTAALSFREWQRDHRDLVKLPD